MMYPNILSMIPIHMFTQVKILRLLSTVSYNNTFQGLFARQYTTSKMPAVELVFPPLKPDAQLLADFALNKPKIFRPFIGVNGLKTTLVGRITEDAGKSIEENTGRAAMVLGT